VRKFQTFGLKVAQELSPKKLYIQYVSKKIELQKESFVSVLLFLIHTG